MGVLFITVKSQNLLMWPTLDKMFILEYCNLGFIYPSIHSRCENLTVNHMDIWFTFSKDRDIFRIITQFPRGWGRPWGEGGVGSGSGSAFFSSSELFWSPVVRRLSVCLSVCKLFTFSSSSPEPLGQFQPNLAQSILGWWGFKFVQIKGPSLFQGEIITK